MSGLRDSLREVDDRHLPVVAGWLRRRLDGASQRRDQAAALAGRWEPKQLDERYGGRGPFALVNRQPVLALGVAGAVFVAGVGVALVREGDGDGARGPGSSTELLPQNGEAPRGTFLGPHVGDRTDDYVHRATAGLVDAVHASPTANRVALISLSDYGTPEQVDALLAGFTVRRAFLRAKAAGKEAAALPVDIRGKLLAELKTAYAETSRSRAAAQRSYQGYVETLRPDSTQDKAFRDLYAAFARSSGIEAREYAHDCACVYAALVTASPTLLLSLRARPGVRAVEVAGPGLTVLQVQVQPLLPEVVGQVPRPSVGGYS